MTEETSAPAEYIHGQSPEERHRLSRLNDILNASCLSEINPAKGDRVLDVGSGLGQLSRLIARALDDTGQVVGVERDQGQRAQAQHLAEAENEPNLVDFRQGEAEALPLSDAEWGTFDLAHARFLLEHVPDPAAVVAQMVKAVRPGGRVFISDDDHGDFRPWPEPPGFPDLWNAYVRMYERLGNDPYVGRRLVWLLKKAGLTSIRNASVFFGGCAGDDKFEATADNLIGVLAGAREAILAGDLLDAAAFDAGMAALQQWKSDPSAALWYSMCCAEGRVPG